MIDGQNDSIFFYSQIRFWICFYWYVNVNSKMEYYNESGQIFLYNIYKYFVEIIFCRMQHFFEIALYYDCAWIDDWIP